MQGAEHTGRAGKEAEAVPHGAGRHLHMEHLRRKEFQQLGIAEASTSPFQAIPLRLMGNTGDVQGTKRSAQKFPIEASARCELLSEG